jgi:hypothetical protein
MLKFVFRQGAAASAAASAAIAAAGALSLLAVTNQFANNQYGNGNQDDAYNNGCQIPLNPCQHKNSSLSINPNIFIRGKSR